MQLNHIFIKGKVLGVESSDILDELVIPLARPVLQMSRNDRSQIDNLAVSISPQAIPRRSFLNPPLNDFGDGHKNSLFMPVSQTNITVSKLISDFPGLDESHIVNVILCECC